MQRIRIKNLVSPIAELSGAELARGLQSVKPDLAALVACYEFEQLIRQVGSRQASLDQGRLLKLEEVIAALPNYGPIDPFRKKLWIHLKGIRNRFIHSGKIPSQKQTHDLIREIERIVGELEREEFDGRRG